MGSREVFTDAMTAADYGAPCPCCGEEEPVAHSIDERHWQLDCCGCLVSGPVIICQDPIEDDVDRKLKDHVVLGYVDHDHTMNGRPCPGMWAVVRMKHSGTVAFDCQECKVALFGGPSYEELERIWNDDPATETIIQ